ncbi:MAG: transcriptional repressor LexA [Chitinivibrionales bacterium]|nr:transcriptional repressor LexA [Chitinivibrionales bacterium]MBD3397319.1 transcriptional repressor LexA [Chitinivibrionales bacterium]
MQGKRAREACVCCRQYSIKKKEYCVKKLTTLQKRVLRFIIRQQKKIGAPPTIREIAEYFNYSSINSVRQHLRLIERKGYIKVIPWRARGIEVVVGFEQEQSKNEVQVPLVGAVAAGKPITAVENIDGYISLDRTIFKGGDLFTLRIKGDSMKDIGVLDGDIVIVRQQADARDNDVVVAIIDGEATLKRFLRKPGQVILRAENPAYKDIVVRSNKDLWIVGKMVGVMRKC